MTDVEEPCRNWRWQVQGASRSTERPCIMRAISPTLLWLKENALHGNNDSQKMYGIEIPPSEESSFQFSVIPTPCTPLFTMGQVTGSSRWCPWRWLNAEPTGESWAGYTAWAVEPEFENIMTVLGRQETSLVGRATAKKLGSKHIVTTHLFGSSLGFSTSALLAFGYHSLSWRLSCVL